MAHQTPYCYALAEDEYEGTINGIAIRWQNSAVEKIYGETARTQQSFGLLKSITEHFIYLAAHRLQHKTAKILYVHINHFLASLYSAEILHSNLILERHLIALQWTVGLAESTGKNASTCQPSCPGAQFHAGKSTSTYLESLGFNKPPLEKVIFRRKALHPILSIVKGGIQGS